MLKKPDTKYAKSGSVNIAYQVFGSGPVDLETGGQVFQLHFTNSRGMTEKYLIGETTGVWGEGDIHFGFNVSRVFGGHKGKKHP